MPILLRDVWFDNEFIYVSNQDGKTFRQSLLWYPKLREADEEQRKCFIVSTIGIHWRNLDEDISFESFEYEDADPSPMQVFFLTHKELNIAEFAKLANINPSLLRNYINGFKKPSKEREAMILEEIHRIGRKYQDASF